LFCRQLELARRFQTRQQLEAFGFLSRTIAARPAHQPADGVSQLFSTQGTTRCHHLPNQRDLGGRKHPAAAAKAAVSLVRHRYRS